MRRVILLIGIGLILLGVAGWLLFPEARSDLIERLNIFNRTDNKVTLVYWGLWEPGPVIQPLINQYQSENPNITIEYEQRDPTVHYEYIASQIQQEGAPDIIRIHPSWIPYVSKNLSTVPRSVLSVEDFTRRFYEVNQTYLRDSNNVYALPLMVDGLALVYNKDLYTAASIANPPRTWVEFREFAARLTKRDPSGAMTQAGAALGHAQNVDYFADILALMFAQNGVKFYDDEGQVALHTTQSAVGANLGVEALKFYVLFGAAEPSWDLTFGNSTREFAAGKVGMVLLPSHRIHEVLNLNPQFQMGVSEVPQLPTSAEGSGEVAYANYWVESVTKVSQNQTEAWKFLEWLSRNEQLAAMYRNASDIRSFGEPYPSEELQQSLATEVYTYPYVTQANNYVTSYISYGSFNAQMNDRIVEVLRNLIEQSIKVETGELRRGSLNEELNVAGTQIQQILDQAAESAAAR